MIAEMKRSTKKYEKLLIEKTKNIQHELKEHRQHLNEEKKPNESNQNQNIQNNKKNSQIEENISKNKNVEEFYQSLKKILNKEDIYLPYLENGMIRYLSVFTDKNANQTNLKNTNVFILAGSNQDSISKNQLRLFKSSFVEKIKQISSSKRRSLIRDILSHPDIYENETEEISTENPFISYMKNINEKYGAEKRSLIFISETQMYKISQMIQS
jgi:hypothetical protein